MTDPRITALPDHTRRHLDTLRSELVAKLGDQLAAIVVFGSLARGGWDALRSDIDLVIVFADDPRASLKLVGPSLELARNAARIEAILLRADELQAAADVFPLFYDDIRSRNILLHGSDPFAALVILDEHRRLRIEQELREARIRLRRAAVESATMPGTFAGAIERKLKQMRGPLHALLALRGVAVADDLASVIPACAQRFALDLAALARVRETPEAAYDALVRLLDAATRDVDTATRED